MGIVFKNNAKTTLSSAVNNSTTTIPVTEGSVFPAVNLSGAGTFFLLTLDDETNNEIVKVTSCSGASGNINLTVIRAQEGTTARAFGSGDKAELRFTSGTVDEIRSDNTVHTNIFTTANNSTTDFTLSDEVANENDLVVFIDGVFQAHNTFSVSGTTLTLATAPASGRVVTVYSIKGSRSASNVALATMTGDNSDTTLTLPVEPINENSVQVFFDGVYQNKDSFSISGTTLTFGVAPPTGVAVEALVFTKLAINTSSILSDTDADTKVQVEESSDEDKIRFDTAGSERMIIDGSGNVGIGTDTPSQKLHVYNSTLQVGSKTGDTSIQQNTNAIRISALPNSSTEWGGLQWYREFSDYIGAEIIAARAGTAESDTDLIFKTSTSSANATERMRITHGGLVGIGTNSPTSALQVVGDASVGSGFTQIRSGHPSFSITNGNTDTVYFSIAPDGGSYSTFMEVVDDDTDVDSIKLKTSGSERMRIDSSGNVLIGTTSTSSFPANERAITLLGSSMTISHNTSNGSGDSYVRFGRDTNLIGSITQSGNNAVAYNTTSDYRLKENVNYEFDALSRVAQLKPARFNFIADADTTVDGFIAHEVSDIVPEAITGEKDGEEMQGIDQSKLVPLLTKAIQELSAKIEELEGKIE